MLAPALLVTGLVHGIGMNADPAPVDDEGTYMAEAWAVQVHHTLTPYTYWYDHPPLGWIQIAGWTALTDGFRRSIPAVVSGRQFMLVAFLVSAALLFVVARRLGLGRGWATAAVLAFGLSPLAVEYQRMVYLDNLAVPWMLAAFALVLSPRRRLWAYTAGGACFAVAVLSKETVLVFAPALVWQAWQGADRRTRAFCITGLTAVFGLVVAGYPLFAALKGELLPGKGHVSLASAVAFQLYGRPGTGSVLTWASQGHHLVAGWLYLDPWLPAVGTVAAVGALFVRHLRPVGIAVLIGVLMVCRGGYLPVPYPIAILPFAALAAAGMAEVAWSRARVAATARRRAAVRWLPRVVALALAGAVLAVAGPAWASGIHTETTTDQWLPLRHGEAWIEAHVPRHDRILVDDSMWVDLVDHGFDQQLGVVWFYKLGYVNNLDPSVARRLPGGWRDFQYVVSTPSLRSAVAGTPPGLRQVTQALRHSEPVARFGTGPNRVVVRRIARVPTGHLADRHHGRRPALAGTGRRKAGTSASGTSPSTTGPATASGSVGAPAPPSTASGRGSATAGSVAATTGATTGDRAGTPGAAAPGAPGTQGTTVPAAPAPAPAPTTSSTASTSTTSAAPPSQAGTSPTGAPHGYGGQPPRGPGPGSTGSRGPGGGGFGPEPPQPHPAGPGAPGGGPA